MLGDLALLIYFYKADATSTHISVLCASPSQKMKRQRLKI